MAPVANYIPGTQGKDIFLCHQSAADTPDTAAMKRAGAIYDLTQGLILMSPPIRGCGEVKSVFADEAATLIDPAR
jgi:hypothetical protein